MPRESPQSIVVDKRSWGQRVAHGALAQKLIVMPPKIKTTNGEVFAAKDGVARRWLHNLGTTPVKYLIDDGKTLAGENEPNCTAEIFHDVLAGGSATDDGFGSMVDLSGFKGRVTIFESGGTPRVAVIEMYEWNA